MGLFLKDAEFEAFERTLEKTLENRPMRICAYCLMANHWHFVLWPERDGDLDSIRRSVLRGQTYGREDWVKRTAAELGLQSTPRSRGRPRKNPRKFD